MKLINANRDQFEALAPIRQIISHPHARRYAIAQIDPWGNYGLSWQSDLIEPVILESALTWIGVDQKIVALHQGKMQAALPLTFPLLEILEIGQAIVVITELELFIFNPDGSLRFTKGLSDVVATWSVEADYLSIELFDQTTIQLNLQVGKMLAQSRSQI